MVTLSRLSEKHGYCLVKPNVNLDALLMSSRYQHFATRLHNWDTTPQSISMLSSLGIVQMLLLISNMMEQFNPLKRH